MWNAAYISQGAIKNVGGKTSVKELAVALGNR